MTPEEQRFAIATAMGIDPVLAANNNCPDYLNDLNAMHEAEKHLLCTTEVPKYISLLSNDMGDWTKLLYATASQRAESFLKTIGKWKPSTVPKCDIEHASASDSLPSKVPAPSDKSDEERKDL